MLSRLIRFLRPLRGAWVRVHLKDAPSVEGVYLRRRAGYVFVDAPTILPERGGEEKLGGKLAIPAHRVVFVQVMPQ